MPDIFCFITFSDNPALAPSRGQKQAQFCYLMCFRPFFRLPTTSEAIFANFHMICFFHSQLFRFYDFFQNLCPSCHQGLVKRPNLVFVAVLGRFSPTMRPRAQAPGSRSSLVIPKVDPHVQAASSAPARVKLFKKKSIISTTREKNTHRPGRSLAADHRGPSPVPFSCP